MKVILRRFLLPYIFIKNEREEQLGSINSKLVASPANSVNWQFDYISELNWEVGYSSFSFSRDTVLCERSLLIKSNMILS